MWWRFGKLGCVMHHASSSIMDSLKCRAILKKRSDASLGAVNAEEWVSELREILLEAFNGDHKGQRLLSKTLMGVD